MWMMRVVVLLREQESWVYPPILLECQNKRFGGWARPIFPFPLVKPSRKSTPGGRWCSPLQAKPAHNISVCTDSNGNQAKQDKPAGRSPCRRSAMFCPHCCFWRPALPEQSAETIAYITKKKHNNGKEKARARKHKEKQAKAKKESKADHPPIHTISRKAYKQTSKREKKSYTIPPYAYI